MRVRCAAAILGDCSTQVLEALYLFELHSIHEDLCLAVHMMLACSSVSGFSATGMGFLNHLLYNLVSMTY